jgi:HEAT repeat protein
MLIKDILSDKTLKPKAKTEVICNLILENTLSTSALIEYAQTAKDTEKATCIEALEYATKKQDTIADINCIKFVAQALTEKSPRIKWESAKAIGNIAHLYPDKLDTAIKNLLINAAHSGTVVRWSTAYALGEIIKTGHIKTKILIPAIENIAEQEEKNSIKKIYLSALKQIKDFKTKK